MLACQGAEDLRYKLAHHRILPTDDDDEGKGWRGFGSSKSWVAGTVSEEEYVIILTSPDVGSSSNRMEGSERSSVAIAKRFLSPPEIPGRLVSQSIRHNHPPPADRVSGRECW